MRLFTLFLTLAAIAVSASAEIDEGLITELAQQEIQRLYPELTPQKLHFTGVTTHPQAQDYEQLTAHFQIKATIKTTQLPTQVVKRWDTYPVVLRCRTFPIRIRYPTSR